MEYTAKDLSPVVAVLNKPVQDLPPATKAKALGGITPEEMNEVMSGLQTVLFEFMFSGETVENLKTYLSLNEKMAGYMKRTMQSSDLAQMYDVRGLGAGDVKMLRDLGFPKTAGVIEAGIEALAIAPNDPSALKTKANLSGNDI
jgi:hypothetical protein